MKDKTVEQMMRRHEYVCRLTWFAVYMKHSSAFSARALKLEHSPDPIIQDLLAKHSWRIAKRKQEQAMKEIP